MNMLPTNQIGVPDEERRSGKLKVGDDCVRQNAAFQPPTLMQEGFGFGLDFDFDFDLPKLKPKARKKDAMEVYGGRIIRSTGRKDRHSKVCTARGTRDRRVRLSPKTAILFYDVQERLGYDRPSKAIDWLMEEANAAIDALIEPPPPTSNVVKLNANNLQLMKAESGINAVENSEQLNYGDYSISSFGHLTQAATTPYCSRSEERFSPAPLATSPEIFDPNAEFARLKRIFSCNYNSSPPPLNFPAAVDLGHGNMFTDREPLQSRFSNPTLQFPVASFFHEELLNFTGPASFKENPSKASFLK